MTSPMGNMHCVSYIWIMNVWHHSDRGCRSIPAIGRAYSIRVGRFWKMRRLCEVMSQTLLREKFGHWCPDIRSRRWRLLSRRMTGRSRDLSSVSRRRSPIGGIMSRHSVDRIASTTGGYKGGGSRGTAMGYACFGSPEEAVKAIGDRIVRLVASNKSSGPEDMLVWKCGSSCAGHSAESVRSWVASVRMYYDRIVKG